MRRQGQEGFTLIELIVVIVILGILAATALPKFVDLRVDAANAARDGVVGGLTSASAISFGASLVRGTGGNGVVRASGGEACSALASALLQNGVPAGIGFTGNAPTGCSATNSVGATFTCGVSHTATTGAASTTATLLCTG